MHHYFESEVARTNSLAFGGLSKIHQILNALIPYLIMPEESHPIPKQQLRNPYEAPNEDVTTEFCINQTIIYLNCLNLFCLIYKMIFN